MPYLLDANVFIQAKNLHYGLDFCPAFWEWLEQANRAGIAFSIEKVGDELAAVADELSTWAASRGAAFFVKPDAALVPALAHVSQWTTQQSYESAAVNTFLQVADYYLVAHALAHGFTLVTHEVPSSSTKKVKIPNACIGVGVKCMSPYEMLRVPRFGVRSLMVPMARSQSTLDEQALERDTLAREVARRRTFAIISHPDAGKTTLTEKLLLYSGAIELAGAVRGRKSGRHATSDWMEMEQQRGISISAAALEFEMDGHHVTLLDTPGHQDFSEDTYRTLLAVDSVVMVIDAAKGIEAQTLKLFEVCRSRRIPVLTFINKLDQPSRDPFELMDEIERVLGIAAAPMNWPLGDGPDFRGVYDLVQRHLLLWDRQGGGTRTEPIAVADPADAQVAEIIGKKRQRQLIDDVEIISGAGTQFDENAYLAEKQTAVFFGSALNDFGVEPFLRALLSLAPPPRARLTEEGIVDPTDPSFSGFVFKIQANMNPRHRDRVAFFRICSGRLSKDMLVQHERLGTPLRLSRVYRFFGRDRETVPEAYPGDVVGLVNPGQLAIGDTLYAGTRVRFPPIPMFPAEHFGKLRPAEGRHKKFDEAVQQLAEEGLLQLFVPRIGPREAIVGVVGALQFDVIEARMASEYGIPCKVDPLSYVAARWPVPADRELKLPYSGAVQVIDRQQRDALLFASEWALNYTIEQNPDVRFHDAL